MFILGLCNNSNFSLQTVTKDSAMHAFQCALQRLVINTCADHPYHVAYVLIAMRNTELTTKEQVI